MGFDCLLPGVQVPHLLAVTLVLLPVDLLDPPLQPYVVARLLKFHLLPSDPRDPSLLLHPLLLHYVFDSFSEVGILFLLAVILPQDP